MRSFPCAFSKVLRPEKLAPHLFEVDEDVEKDEVSHPITSPVPLRLGNSDPLFSHMRGKQLAYSANHYRVNDNDGKGATSSTFL